MVIVLRTNDLGFAGTTATTVPVALLKRHRCALAVQCDWLGGDISRIAGTNSGRRERAGKVKQ